MTEEVLELTTLNSVYQLDLVRCRVRFVSGMFGPTMGFSPAGQWHDYRAISLGCYLSVEWPSPVEHDGQYGTTTSTIVSRRIVTADVTDGRTATQPV